jgi:N-acetylglucosamine-6-phosphate deacetylase
MKAIINGRILAVGEDGHFTVLAGKALLYDTRIEAIIPYEKLTEREDVLEIINAGGRYVSPGFINMHIHGCGGADTMDDDARAIPLMQRLQAKTGVTSFLPTTMTYDFPSIYRALEHVRTAMRQDTPGAGILGCHMEGPFINVAHKGAQAATNIAKADFARIAPYKDIVKLITLAPEELGGDYRFVEECRSNGILVSIGHSSADYAGAMEAITQHGVRHITHLFNAMTGLHHRKPGGVGAALDSDAVCELIADNVHVHPAAQRIVYAAKHGENIVLITDSMRACLMGDGESELGGQCVFVKGQVATLADGTIAGSVLTMDRAVNNFASNTGVSLPRIVELVTRVPAQELGVYDSIGVISIGHQADLTIFDDAVRIMVTIVAGRTVYEQGR